jgi:phage shock protein PspC (stress-responsive transcriptional regulator)
MESATPGASPAPPITPPPPPPQPQPHRLTRSTRDRMWAGVAGGLAEYLDLDPALVRLIWVLAAVLTGGLAIPIYIVAWIIIPRDSPASVYGSEVIHDWSHELHNEAQRLADEARRMAAEVRGAAHAGAWSGPDAYPPTVDPAVTPPPPQRHYGRHGRATGVVLVVLGMVLLSANAGLLRWVDWNVLWPVIFIGLGLALLARQADWGH